MEKGRTAEERTDIILAGREMKIRRGGREKRRASDGRTRTAAGRRETRTACKRKWRQVRVRERRAAGSRGRRARWVLFQQAVRK